MEKIKITKGENADNRTAKDLSEKAMRKDTLNHIEDVRKTMNLLGYMLTKQGSKHDYTKLTEFESFHNDFKSKFGKDFVEGDWYQLHITEERHHIDRYLHDDVNLLDVIEHIVDVIVAGKARSGEVNNTFNGVTEKMLKKAFNNTVDMIDNLTELE